MTTEMSTSSRDGDKKEKEDRRGYVRLLFFLFFFVLPHVLNESRLFSNLSTAVDFSSLAIISPSAGLGRQGPVCWRRRR
jgi:hypothetical protein